ncbi:hypothetical protein GCM10010271_72380 [Streptomyces kurssanovii]|nr:hypothetical protein GCM10010271_72380 [Streptomyces kurssanovii]
MKIFDRGVGTVKLRWGRCALRRRRRAAALTALTMALSVMTLPAASAVPATDSPLAPLTEGQKALAQASESGERVEVVGERSRPRSSRILTDSPSRLRSLRFRSE